jgi:hypothetical protein
MTYLDYQLLQQKFDALEHHCKGLEAEIDAMQVIRSISSKLSQSNKKFQKSAEKSPQKYIPNSDNFVSILKYQEMTDMFRKEKLKNDRIREEVASLKK